MYTFELISINHIVHEAAHLKFLLFMLPDAEATFIVYLR